jgi:SAM-dependent methyltransferase
MRLKDTFFYITGIGTLTLVKAKHIIQGYTSPKPFKVSETARCIEYDINVVEHWLSHLQKYTQDANFIAGKNVLELGPGSDLGIGLYLLSKECLQYNACDVNHLMEFTPDRFYEQLFEKLKSINSQTDIAFLKEQVNEAKAGNQSRLNYKVRQDFDLVFAFGEATVDLVFSQAAFEHFDDIYATISQLSAVCKPGATLVAEIDLKTHSRWICDKDPNNIYRYSNCVYNAFWFRGIPNRIRPYQYKEAFELAGWTDISITPLIKLNDHDSSSSGMNKAFTDKKNQMDYLTFMICARNGGVA